MFSLGFIFMVNDSQELSVIFVPVVLPDQTPMVEVFFKKANIMVYSLQIINIFSSAASFRRCPLS